MLGVLRRERLAQEGPGALRHRGGARGRHVRRRGQRLRRRRRVRRCRGRLRELRGHAGLPLCVVRPAGLRVLRVVRVAAARRLRGPLPARSRRCQAREVWRPAVRRPACRDEGMLEGGVLREQDVLLRRVGRMVAVHRRHRPEDSRTQHRRHGRAVGPRLRRTFDGDGALRWQRPRGRGLPAQRVDRLERVLKAVWRRPAGEGPPGRVARQGRRQAVLRGHEDDALVQRPSLRRRRRRLRPCRLGRLVRLRERRPPGNAEALDVRGEERRPAVRGRGLGSRTVPGKEGGELHVGRLGPMGRLPRPLRRRPALPDARDSRGSPERRRALQGRHRRDAELQRGDVQREGLPSVAVDGVVAVPGELRLRAPDARTADH
mmetsp:Transcript_17776/g.50617  ORF Transcript_17776/g.50617 Transcript_17776/m.50617 type:complete len:375 (+) Transcript_17776:2295-3419(+)